MKRIKKLLAACGILAAAIVLLVGVYVAEENIRGRVLRSRAERRLKDQGEPSTLAELHLPAPPADNAGPAMVKLAAELSAIAKTKPLFQMPPSGLMAPEGKGRAAIHFRDPYFPTSKSYELSKKEKGLPSVEWTEVERELAETAPLLEKFRQALQQPGAPTVDYNKPTALSEDVRAWQTIGWLGASAETALHAGNLGAATDNLVALCQLFDYSRKDRHLVAQTMAETIQGFTVPLIWEALQAPGWNDEQLARLQAALLREDHLDTTLTGLLIERFQIPVLFAQMRESASSRAMIFRMDNRNFMDMLFRGSSESEDPSEAMVWLKSALWQWAWSYQDEARALDNTRELLLHARKLRETRSWADFSRAYPKERQPLRGVALWKNILSETLHPQAFRECFARAARNGTEEAMAVAAVALKRQMLKTGKAPASLNELVPGLLRAIPFDLMDGKPLKYRAGEGTDFTLYSVGLDGVDDGGDPIKANNPPERNGIWSEKDAVWPQVAVP